MKKAKIYFQDLLAGTLAEDENGFTFAYDTHYLQHSAACPVSLTLPLRAEAYQSDVMFPFFD